MTSLNISGPYFWSGIARPGPTLPPPMIQVMVSSLYKGRERVCVHVCTVQWTLFIMDTLGQESLSPLYRGVLYVEVSKECNWYTRCCPLNGGVHYRECPL